MADNDWVNRTTRQHITGFSPASMTMAFGGSFVDVNGDANSTAAWIYNPSLTAVAGFAPKYWIITGDLVTLMDVAARAVVDAADAAAFTQANRDANTDEIVALTAAGVNVRALIEVFNQRDNYMVNRLANHEAIIQAMLDSTGAVANMRTDGLAISFLATNTRTKANTVTAYTDEVDSGGSDS